MSAEFGNEPHLGRREPMKFFTTRFFPCPSDGGRGHWPECREEGGERLVTPLSNIWLFPGAER